MRSQTLGFGLITLLLSLTRAQSVLAEPPALIPYANPSTGECGLVWAGLENEVRTPRDRGFGAIGLPWKPEECRRLLDKVLAYPEALRTPSRDLLGEARTKPACERLALSLPVSAEHTCKALGYRYVGELPVSTRPCYPNLAPFLGASCAPLIWIHLGLLGGSLGFVAALAYVMLARRAARRRALAAAGAPAPPMSDQ